MEASPALQQQQQQQQQQPKDRQPQAETGIGVSFIFKKRDPKIYFLFQVFSTQRVEFFRGMRHEVEDDYSSDFLDDLCYGGDFTDEGDYWLDQR